MPRCNVAEYDCVRLVHPMGKTVDRNGRHSAIVARAGKSTGLRDLLAVTHVASSKLSLAVCSLPISMSPFFACSNGGGLSSIKSQSVLDALMRHPDEQMCADQVVVRENYAATVTSTFVPCYY